MVAAVIHAAVPCARDRVVVMALGQQIAMFCLFLPPMLATSAGDILTREQPGRSLNAASPAEGLFQSECRFPVICRYAPGISMVETTSASSSMSMTWRWKSLLLSDCR